MKTNSVRKPGRPVDPTLKDRRCEEILDAAARLFAKHGFSETDTQILANKLQVGKGTIYRYFPSKQELFLAAVDRVMQQMTASVNESIADIDDPLERIATAIQTFLTFTGENPDMAELLIQERAQFKDRKKPTYVEYREASRERWSFLYRELIAAGRVRDMPVERIMNVIGDLVYGTMFTNYFNGPRSSPEEQARDILDIVLNGILSEKGRQKKEGGK